MPSHCSRRKHCIFQSYSLYEKMVRKKGHSVTCSKDVQYETPLENYLLEMGLHIEESMQYYHNSTNPKQGRKGGGGEREKLEETYKMVD